jgi:hypothetical protein
MNGKMDSNRAFYAMLAEDAADALKNLDSDNSELAKRNFVRSAFAAIEGLLWQFRRQVELSIESERDLTVIERAAFNDKSYAIGENGNLQEQTKIIPMTAMFRFSVRAAEMQYNQILVDFSDINWSTFKAAIAIRNRITHPKNVGDLSLSDQDVTTVKDGLFWLLETILHVLKQLNLAAIEHNEIARKVLADLKSGDPETLSEYQRLLNDDA